MGWKWKEEISNRVFLAIFTSIFRRFWRTLFHPWGMVEGVREREKKNAKEMLSGRARVLDHITQLDILTFWRFDLCRRISEEEAGTQFFRVFTRRESVVSIKEAVICTHVLLVRWDILSLINVNMTWTLSHRVQDILWGVQNQPPNPSLNIQIKTILSNFVVKLITQKIEALCDLRVKTTWSWRQYSCHNTRTLQTDDDRRHYDNSKDWIKTIGRNQIRS